MANLECFFTEYIYKKYWNRNISGIFQSLSQAAGFTLHIENLYGKNTHHIIESCFKAFAITLRRAISIDLINFDNIPSTKGTLSGNY